MKFTRREFTKGIMGAAALGLVRPNAMAMSEPDALKALLGRGVNIFTAKYLEQPRKGRVIVTDGMIESSELNSTEVQKTYGSTYTEFITKFAAEAGLQGSFGGFSGSIDTKYSKDAYQSTTTQFIRIYKYSSGSMLSISKDPATLKDHLSPEFIRALKEKKPLDLFNTYGTHVAVDVISGGMAEYYGHSKESAEINETKLEVAATAKYKSLGASVGASLKITAEEKETIKNVEGGESLKITGGSDVARQNVEGKVENSWTDWAGSLKQHPGFLGFPNDGLVPIWDLVDEEKSKELQHAFKLLCAQNFTVRIFSSTGASSNRPDAQVRIPDDYKLLSGGARINQGNVNCLLTASFPESLSTWRATGKDHIVSGSGTMTVYALAVHDPLKIWKTEIFETTSKKVKRPDAKVPVPADFTMVGGGAQLSSSEDLGNLITASYPTDKNTWEAKAKDHPGEGVATITAFAIGLKSTIEAGIETNITKSKSPTAPHPKSTAPVGPDSKMAGGGAHVDYSGLGNLITASYPTDSKTWEAKSQDHTTSDPATITAYALGIKVSVA